MNIELREVFVNYTPRNVRTVEGESGLTVRGVDAAANDKIRRADLALELELDITLFVAVFDECI